MSVLTERGREPDHVETWLINHISACLGLEREAVACDVPLSELGLSSSDLVLLSGELETWLGLELSPTLAWEHPTIERLAAHLSTLCRRGEDFE